MDPDHLEELISGYEEKFLLNLLDATEVDQEKISILRETIPVFIRAIQKLISTDVPPPDIIQTLPALLSTQLNFVLAILPKHNNATLQEFEKLLLDICQSVYDASRIYVKDCLFAEKEKTNAQT